MALTRAQVRTRSRQTAGSKGFSAKTSKKPAAASPLAKKRKVEDNENLPSEGENSPPRIKRRTQTGKSLEDDAALRAMLGQVIAKYGDAPLRGLVDEQQPASKVVMAHILNAMLSSTRISHQIAWKTLECLLEHNYDELNILHRTSWQERNDLVTEGGYARYNEKTATRLGQLTHLMKQKYGNDASRILPDGETGDEARSTLSARLQEINGIGPLATDIFLGSIQQFFPNVAPFLDTRSRKTAKAIGLGDDIDAMFAALDRSPFMMAKLEVALTTIRLEKREKEFAESSKQLKAGTT